MTLSYEDKLEIYRLKKSGVSWSQLVNQFGGQYGNLQYLVRLMDRYGVDCSKKRRDTLVSSKTTTTVDKQNRYHLVWQLSK
ncbi:hypothetical protein MX111_08425 [Streptococcus uberis]|uniref:hypothetical protein n=1 Tax=Streptococcus uberis TaxID=1349 RepID=UPI0027DAEEAA|nr:hypothetical protein [Streptococcus uberis]MCK1239433.1 hypothetical protein [Streptococcus uberis]